MAELYDTIGRTYGQLRRPEPRFEREILRALGDSASVVNVGAGSGSYEPSDRRVIAVEPSLTMIRQRAAAAPPVVRGVAGALPFRDESFDAALAVLTIHHWPDRALGLAELRRAARRRVVILTHDPSLANFWLYEYFPEIPDIDSRSMPTLSQLSRELGRVTVVDLPVPHDCSDGFLGAYWRRPEAYLSERARSAISMFSKLENVEERVARLRADLASGEWRRRHGALLERESLDVGYRLVIAA